MAGTGDINIEEALKSAFQQQLDAMKLGDTDSLAELLDEGFSLAHYRLLAPQDGRLAQMRAGQFAKKFRGEVDGAS